MSLLIASPTRPSLRRATALAGALVVAITCAAIGRASGQTVFQSGTLAGSVPKGWSTVGGSAPAGRGLTGTTQYVVASFRTQSGSVNYRNGSLPSPSQTGAVISLRHSPTAAASTGWHAVKHLTLPTNSKLGAFTTERQMLDGEHVVVTVGFGKNATASTRSTVSKLLASVHAT